MTRKLPSLEPLGIRSYLSWSVQCRKSCVPTSLSFWSDFWWARCWGHGCGLSASSRVKKKTTVAVEPTKDAAYRAEPAGTDYLKQSPAVVATPPAGYDYGLGDGHVSKLLSYPQPCTEGMRTPFDLWRYAGKGVTSWGSPQLRMPWQQWLDLHAKQKPVLMAEVRQYMDGRFNFHGSSIPGVTMSGGRKPVLAGPVARLPKGADSWESLASLSPEQIKQQDLFPYKPLAHPLQSTAHMLFPDAWVKAHPEHRRIDLDFDIPDAYLPEFPPPLFLTTHKELGDVTGGREVTLGNYFEIFDGLLTAEQMEGLKELLRPTPTTWFNQTTHRVTEEPSAGVSCMQCHVNGHTNGAIELAPDSRPNEGRLRVDTPTMRGNFNLMQLSSKRSIRSLDHFCEVEEYFDGDPGLMQAIGPRGAQRQITNRMGDFCATAGQSPGAQAESADETHSKQSDRGRAARRSTVSRQSPLRPVPFGTGVRR